MIYEFVNDIVCLLLVDYCRLLIIMHRMNNITSPERFHFGPHSANSPFKRLSLATERYKWEFFLARKDSRGDHGLGS